MAADPEVEPVPLSSAFSAGKSKSRYRLIVAIGRVVVLLLIFGIWESCARTGMLPAAFIGQPSQFLALLGQKIADGSIFPAILDTLSATLVAFVEAGLGVAAVPRLSMPRQGHPALVSVPIVEPEVTRTVGLIKRRGRSLSPAAEHLYDMLRGAAAKVAKSSRDTTARNSTRSGRRNRRIAVSP